MCKSLLIFYMIKYKLKFGMNEIEEINQIIIENFYNNY